MESDFIETTICEGATILEKRKCRRVWLPDGAAGVIWQGLAFKLGIGDRIDVAANASPPGSCRLWDRSAEQFALIEGNTEAYVLLAGSAIECETVANKLREAKIEVLRTGRYLGDTVGEFEPDWFVRIAPAADARDLRSRLEAILGLKTAVENAADTTSVRLRLLGAELLSAQAREASLKSELTRLRAITAATVDEAREQTALLEIAVAEEKKIREKAEAALASLPTPARTVPAPRLQAEIQTVAVTFLPNIVWLRDSMTVLAAEFANRRALWRLLGELTRCSGFPTGWKKLKALDGWWESHVNTGHDDAGRIYARWRSESAVWELLVSQKTEQARDLAWLARR
jgi:hypothetical protein